MRRIVGACAVVTLLLLGCSDDSTPQGSTSDSSASSTVPSSTSSTGTITAQVFFLDQDAFNIGRPPYTRPVDRTVSKVTPANDALTALFAGPTSDEAAAGLLFVASGATGFTDLRIVDGTAHVQLVGGCSSGGSTFTVADEITMTLRQFSSVQDVKIYDPSGQTEQPDEPGDSIPVCLEP